MKNIHLIPTDKTSRLHLGNLGLVLCDLNFNENTINGQHICITSKEEIKEGDWVYTPNKNIMLVKAKYATESSFMISNSNHKKSPYYIEFCRKIVLTTDPDLIKDGVQAIDDDFLEWFVKNPSCESVEVELDYDCGLRIIDGKKLGYYSIIIPKEEPKQSVEEYEQQGLEKHSYELQQETLEEASYNYASTKMNRTSHLVGFREGAKWQQEQTKRASHKKIDTKSTKVPNKMTEDKFKNSPIHDKKAIIDMMDELEPKEMIEVVELLKSKTKQMTLQTLKEKIKAKQIQCQNEWQCGYQKALNEVLFLLDQVKETERNQMIEFAEFLKRDFGFYGNSKNGIILWELCGTGQRYTTEEVLQEFIQIQGGNK
jgi:hypothetical protein